MGRKERERLRAELALCVTKQAGKTGGARAAERARELREVLDRANRAYYADATPVMSDVEFDRLLAELVEIERAHPELWDAASPTQRVGGEVIGGFQTRAHSVAMLSIDNSYSTADVLEWHARVLKGLGIKEGDAEESLFGGTKRRGDDGGAWIVADPKVDGVAVSVRYERRRLAYALTRGDGVKGDDITANMRTVRALPLTLGEGAPEVLEVRGEVYMPLKEFERINREREAAGEEAFMNPRNSTAGTLKQLDPKVTASRRLGFVAHGRGEVSDPEFAKSHSEFVERLKSLGMGVNKPRARSRDIKDILRAIEEFKLVRHEQGFATDGMVVRVDEFAQQAMLGVTSKSPRWVIAYKYPAERTTTTLLRVDHQVGKTGKITPRAVMRPVLLAGTTVQHATLHNYGRILDASTDPENPNAERTDIRIGDTVYVEKAGEIIPYVAGVVIAERAKGAKKIEAPEACPECGGPVEVEYDSKRLAELETWPTLANKIATREARLQNPELMKDISDLALYRKQLQDWKKRLDAGEPRPLGIRDETLRMCINPECPAQVHEKLVWFGGRKQMDIEGFGAKTIELIRATHLAKVDPRRAAAGVPESCPRIPLNSFADIFSLHKHRDELLMLEGMGEKKVDNLLNRIEEAKGRGLGRVLAGMGIRHIGDSTAKALARHFSTLGELLGASEERLRPKSLAAARATELGFPETPKDRIETGLGKESAHAVHAYLHSAVAHRTFADLAAAGVDLTSKDFRDSTKGVLHPVGTFAGQTVAITGTLDRYDREELKTLLEHLGAKVLSTVSRNTSLLIAGKSPGSKLAKAESLRVRVVKEDELYSILKDEES